MNFFFLVVGSLTSANISVESKLKTDFHWYVCIKFYFDSEKKKSKTKPGVNSLLFKWTLARNKRWKEMDSILFDLTLRLTDGYPEPCKASKMVFFAEVTTESRYTVFL